MSYDHPYVEMYRHRDIILCCGQGAWEDEMIYSTTRMKELLIIKIFQHGLIFGEMTLIMTGIGGRSVTVFLNHIL